MSTSLLSSIRNHEIREVEKMILNNKLPNCISVNKFYDKVYCAGKVYSILDDVLNHAYKSVRKKLSKKQKNKLKKVQISWIRVRDDKCASIRDGSILLNLTCAKRETLESIIYLRNINHNLKSFERLLQEYKERR